MYSGNPVHKNFLLIVVLFVIVSSVGWILTDSDQKPSLKKNTSNSDVEKTTDQVFKISEVLNGQPASQLGPTMHFYEAALGFDCSNCHVRDNNEWAFEKDDKPEKRRAREMITMMNDINKANFKGEQLVTCFTCHRGTADPEPIPFVITASSLKAKKNGEGEDEVIKVANRLNSAEEIIAKYQQAIGGKEAFDKITSLKMEGKIESGNGNGSSTIIYEKAPCLYYSETKSSQGVMQRGFNGDAGWLKPHGLKEKSKAMICRI